MDEWLELESKQDEFERGEFSRGRGPDGSAFAARLSKLYTDSLERRAREIVEALKTVHKSFNSPLDYSVDAQLLDWGSHALSNAYQGLEGAYVRHLQRFGIQLAHVSGWEHAYALAQVTVANLPRRYLWELRNVPSKHPHQSAVPVPIQVTINNTGTIGALQTGAGSTANVQQQCVGGEISDLRAALAALREALERSEDVEPDARRNLISDLDNAAVELQLERPNTGRLLRWLGGVGAVVGAIGSLQPAYEIVKTFARAIGLPL